MSGAAGVGEVSLRVAVLECLAGQEHLVGVKSEELIHAGSLRQIRTGYAATRRTCGGGGAGTALWMIGGLFAPY
ncbi:hypothetical protein GCM10028867_04810 [Nocardioides pacificus]